MKNVVWASIRFVWYLNFQCFTLSYKSVVSFYFQCFHSRNIFLLYLYIHIYVCSNIWICIFYSENFNEDTILLIHWTTKCRKKKKKYNVIKCVNILPVCLHTFIPSLTILQFTWFFLVHIMITLEFQVCCSPQRPCRGLKGKILFVGTFFKEYFSYKVHINST